MTGKRQPRAKRKARGKAKARAKRSKSIADGLKKIRFRKR